MLRESIKQRSKSQSQSGLLQGDFIIVQALRGIAALAVCWYHFTAWNAGIPQGLVKSSGRYGYLGVEAFFVISGFIVPHSLLVGGYKLPSFLRFLIKRIARIDPPYIASILLSIVAATIARRVPTHAAAGATPQYTLAQLVLHLGYLIPFSKHQAWINGGLLVISNRVSILSCACIAIPAAGVHQNGHEKAFARGSVRRFLTQPQFSISSAFYTFISARDGWNAVFLSTHK
jgi:hypothetical protein